MDNPNLRAALVNITQMKTTCNKAILNCEAFRDRVKISVGSLKECTEKLQSVRTRIEDNNQKLRLGVEECQEELQRARARGGGVNAGAVAELIATRLEGLHATLDDLGTTAEDLDTAVEEACTEVESLDENNPVIEAPVFTNANNDANDNANVGGRRRRSRRGGWTPQPPKCRRCCGRGTKRHKKSGKCVVKKKRRKSRRGRRRRRRR